MLMFFAVYDSTLDSCEGRSKFINEINHPLNLAPCCPLGGSSERSLRATMPIPTHCPCGMRLVHKATGRTRVFCSLPCFRKAEVLLRDLKKLGIRPRYEWAERGG